ncbi:DUF2325 domain-containing protein [Paraburkholderia acidicola]|uniref:DUF2325 domain-containing protein n=1 Tax=Paraburkholderia acidicola TaxID=1912599 RepID=A0ABV1LS76_9BURK
MQAPPFRLARTPGLGQLDDSAGRYPRQGDACCAPSSRPQTHSAKRRTRLWELDSHLHCSVIGTCLSTHELRKLVPRFKMLDRQHATDLEIHHAAVELAIEGGEGGKALHKALDERYATTIRRFDKATDPQAVLALWNEALASGDIPPGYWALITHPQATLDIRQAAFGELHMLSHLVGAANRADIRRLVALEEENAELRSKVERQQSRLHEMSTRHDAQTRELTAQIAQLETQARQPRTADDTAREAEVATLRDALAARDARLALHTSRREAAEQHAADEQERVTVLRATLDETLALLKTVQAEAHAMERTLQTSAAESTDAAASGRPQFTGLEGKRVVYVGGRPGSNAVIRRIVEAAGAALIVHDGGIEDRKGLLAAALPGADHVVFPVDCIDHDSMNMLKRVCERHQVAYFPLRTASVASFVEWLTRTTERDTTGQPPASRFCLRHG